MRFPLPEVAVVDFDAVVSVAFGRIGIRMAGGRVAEIELWVGNEIVDRAPRGEAARRAVAAIRAYLSDPEAPIEVGLAPQGTPFRQRVWAALRDIPPGQTLTYGELARRLGSSPRAVGGACRANPIPLLIPCHRVVSANGPGGYAGDPADGPRAAVKRWLLAHEGVVFDGGA
ncbi:methylated-DNA--[protein]-cysteine S-methyltransferase [Endothiovibrio diazotrophicus]